MEKNRPQLLSSLDIYPFRSSPMGKGNGRAVSTGLSYCQSHLRTCTEKSSSVPEEFLQQHLSRVQVLDIFTIPRMLGDLFRDIEIRRKCMFPSSTRSRSSAADFYIPTRRGSYIFHLLSVGLKPFQRPNTFEAG
ncbi:hypothetical protein M413DRAFT_122011 [Hebeloma cylindrosporum]|uniref:Uncharacterized protein n=1 Tax=Hebeloma cylindrosporum TaxID=76867 RepID=A0A0C3CGI1_HEBCY|nr:hypothetical protein M413DRAFT_122011 [Hebeloma cylindrosporum h7]